MKLEINPKLPPQLTSKSRFVLWRLGEVNPKTNKKRKIPHSANGHKCNALDVTNHISFNEALNALNSGKFSGIGFVTGNGINCLDIDNASEIKKPVQDVLNAFKDTWIEVSQSGDGYHVFFEGEPKTEPHDRPHFQLYKQNQFIALTGNQYGAINEINRIDFDSTFPLKTKSKAQAMTPTPKPRPENPEKIDILELAFKARNGQKIKALYEASANSEDDLRLAKMLNFYTHSSVGGGDSQLLDILKNAPFIEARKTAHKWADYLPRTIKKAVQNIGKTYTPKNVTAIKKQEAKNWKHDLLTTDSGRPKNCLSNIAMILSNDAEFDDVIGLNQFTGKIEKIKKPPYSHAELGEWDDYDDTTTAIFLSNKYQFAATTNHVSEAVNTVSRKHQFHPVADYLNALKWDGKKRLDTALVDYFGATADDPRYPSLIFNAWTISAVARILSNSKDGVKVDTMLILEGEQGIGKSTALRILANNDNWFTDADIDVNSKDSYLAIQGKWIVEMAELDTLNRAEAGTLKAFITRQSDRYRQPYGRRMIDVPRQCVFAGTGNNEEYLKDSTGARRFMPIYCNNIDHIALANDKDQLWAEAVNYYKNGVAWWFDSSLDFVKKEQEKRFDFDAWHEDIETFLEDKNQVTTSEIMIDCLGIDTDKKAKIHQMRVSSIMKLLEQKGWVKGEVKDSNNKRKRGYYKI